MNAKVRVYRGVNGTTVGTARKLWVRKLQQPHGLRALTGAILEHPEGDVLQAHSTEAGSDNQKASQRANLYYLESCSNPSGRGRREVSAKRRGFVDSKVFECGKFRFLR